MAANEAPALGFLAGGGEMGARTRRHDWAATPLGPPEQWPQSLRTALGLVLRAQVPMLLCWGPELIQLFNDAFRARLDPDGKLPTALGRRGADCWAEHWPALRPLIEQARAGGEAAWPESQRVAGGRPGPEAAGFWSFRAGPVWGEGDQVAGVLVVGQDTRGQALVAREEQERYRFALEAAGLGVWEFDVATNTIYWDDRRAALFDQPDRGNLLSFEQGFSLIHPADVAQVKAAFGRALSRESGGHYDMTCRVLGARDGRLRWGRFVGQAYFTAAGAVARFRGVFQDVTREQEAQQQLAASAAKLRMIFDKAPVGIFIVRGPELIFELMNERYQEMTGRPASFVGRPFGSGLPVPVPELPEAIRLLREVLRTGQPMAFGEFQIHLPRNGRLEPGYYNMVFEPLPADESRPAGVFATIAEVTRSVLSRHRVEANEAYLQRVFRHAAVGIAIFQGEDYVIELANPVACALAGLPAEQLLGRPLFGVLPEAARWGEKVLAEVRRTGQPYLGTELPWVVARAEGPKTIYVDLVCEPLVDEAGQVSRVIQTMTDVSERVRARRHVEELLERERQLNELKSNFVTLASHEFRTPMGTILSSAALIGRYDGAGQQAQRQRHVQRIKAAVQGLTGLLEDFIALSRMEQQPPRGRPQLLEIRDFCAEILEDVQRVLKPGQRLVYEHLSGAPTISIHGQLLKHILLNLLGNASKYSADGKKIVLTTAVRDRQLRLTVQDEGIGIPEPDRDQLFVSFFRARNARHIQGTGLGLYLVRHYVDLLGGHISFTSQLEAGTTFTVQLPLPPSFPPRHENHLRYRRHPGDAGKHHRDSPAGSLRGREGGQQQGRAGAGPPDPARPDSVRHYDAGAGRLRRAAHPGQGPRAGRRAVHFSDGQSRAGRLSLRHEPGADDYLTKPFDDLTLLNAVEVRLHKSERESVRPAAPPPGGLDQLAQAFLNGEDARPALGEHYLTTQYGRKHRLFAAGSWPSALYFISRGRLKLFKTDEVDNEYITALLGPGDFVGYLALLEETAYAETAEVLDDADVCLIPKADFLTLIYHNQPVAAQFMRVLAGDVAEHQQRLLKLAYQSVRKRVAEALLMMQRKFYPLPGAPAAAGGGAFQLGRPAANTSLPMNLARETLAHLVGASTETVIRVLGDLRAEGLISLSDRQTTLLDLDKLARLKH